VGDDRPAHASRRQALGRTQTAGAAELLPNLIGRRRRPGRVLAHQIGAAGNPRQPGRQLAALHIVT
jgi:hypothetical protein